MDFESIKAFLDNPVTKLTTFGGAYGLLGGSITYILNRAANIPEFSDKEILYRGLNYTGLWTIFNTLLGFPILGSLMTGPGFYAGFVGSYVTLETILNKLNPKQWKSKPLKP